MSDGFKAPPVPGYNDVDAKQHAAVKANKEMEERVLRQLDELGRSEGVIDARWLNIARTHIEQGFMAMNRAVFKPGRILLPEDRS